MKRLTILTLFVLLGMYLQAGTKGTAKRFFENDPLTKDANVGVLITDLKTGEVVDSYRENHLLPTASTMKVISTATALELLGGDYRWSTYLETDGRIENGILLGDLYIRGTGDPSLGSKEIGDRQFLQTWVRAIRAAGIRRIHGAIVADLTMFDNGDAMNNGWLWDDMGNYYGMGIFSLNYLDNTLQITLRSMGIGSVAEVISTYPQVDGLTFENHIRCTQITYDGAYVHGMPFCNKRYLTGSIPSNLGTFGLKGDLPNPGLILAQDLQRELEHAGIETLQEATYRTEGSQHVRTLIYEHKSPTLRELAAVTNIHSNNLYAESIFRTLGLRGSVPATITQSKQIVEQCWKSRGVNWGTSIQVDGCGLAPQNGIAPATFVSLLRYMYKSPNYRDFYNSLPVSGESGTLKGFLRDTPLHGRVHAKSGSIAHLKSYTGYIHLPDGRNWAFSVVVNNGNGKSKVVQKAIERYLLQVSAQN